MVGLVARAAVIVFAALTIHPVCDFYFDCGCLPIGFGGLEHCNIQVAGPPDCPWCHGGPVRLAWVAAIIAAGIGVGFHGGKRWGGSAWHVVAGGLIGFALGTAIASLAAAYAGGYPTWLGIRVTNSRPGPQPDHDGRDRRWPTYSIRRCCTAAQSLAWASESTRAGTRSPTPSTRRIPG